MPVRHLVTAILLCLTTGCTSMQHSTRSMWAAMRPVSSPSAGDHTGDPWVKEAGGIARGERPVEKVNDPLKLRNVFMSEQARDIERNLGVGD